jgi:zinc protease
MLLALLLGAAMLPPAFAAPGTPEIRRLPNGLRVVLLEDHAVPLLAVSLWVHCGSKDEIESSAGFAHFLEHLVQRGASGTGPFEYQRLAYRWGGTLSVRSNYDRTQITLTGTPSTLDDLIAAAAAMGLGADLKADQLDRELGPLIQEVRNYYDDPSSVAFLEAVRAAFPGHPYRFPPLGNFRTIGAMKREPLAAFYRNLYVPNNMVLVVAGDFAPARAMPRVEAAFGRAARSGTLPPKPAPPAVFPDHSDIEKRLDLKENWGALVFTTPGYRHPDRPALEVLARLLDDLGGHPIFASVVRSGAASTARALQYTLEDGGLLYVSFNPATPELSYDAAAAVLQEMIRIKETGAAREAVRRAAGRLVEEHRRRGEALVERAEALGEAALFGGLRYYWDLPATYSRLTEADLRRVLDTWIVPENLRLVLVLPKETPPLSEESKKRFHDVFDRLGKEGAPAPRFERVLFPAEAADRATAAAWGDPADARGLGAPRGETLDNGLTVLVQPDRRFGSAAASLHLQGGSGDDPPGKEGLASLAGLLIATGGHARPDAPPAAGGPPVSAAAEGLPAVVPETEVSRDFTEIRFQGPPDEVRRALEGLAATLRRGPEDEKMFEAVRRAARQALTRSQQDPSFLSLELFREKVYAGHRYAHPPVGTAPGLEAATWADAVAAARRLAPRAAALAITGDVEPAEILRLVRDLFGPWKGGEEAPRAAGGATGTGAGERAGAAAQPGEYSRALASPQSHVVVGVPGAPLADADFDGLRRLGTALTLLAFEDLVFARRAAFSAAVVPDGLRRGGALAIGVVAPHPRRDEAVFDLQRLMRRLATEPLGERDLLDVRRIQAGREAAGDQGLLARASSLAWTAAAGNPPTPPVAEPAAEAKRLQEVAARYFRPGSWIVVRVGP